MVTLIVFGLVNIIRIKKEKKRKRKNRKEVIAYLYFLNVKVEFLSEKNYKFFPSNETKPFMYTKLLSFCLPIYCIFR